MGQNVRKAAKGKNNHKRRSSSPPCYTLVAMPTRASPLPFSVLEKQTSPVSGKKCAVGTAHGLRYFCRQSDYRIHGVLLAFAMSRLSGSPSSCDFYAVTESASIFKPLYNFFPFLFNSTIIILIQVFLISCPGTI